MLSIGLFGTCGGSKWREAFKARYGALNIPYFSPETEDWNPDRIQDEVRHLREDDLIVFAVTGEAYSLGALTEIGVALVRAAQDQENRVIMLYIEQDLNPDLDNPIARAASIRARELLLQHCHEIQLRNVILCEGLTSLLMDSILVYRTEAIHRYAMKQVRELSMKYRLRQWFVRTRRFLHGI